MSETLRLESLLSLARVRLAMSDSLGAIDLLHLVARCALATALASPSACWSASLRAELALVVEPVPPMPRFAIRGHFLLRSGADASTDALYAALDEKIARCLGDHGEMYLFTSTPRRRDPSAGGSDLAGDDFALRVRPSRALLGA